MKNFRLLFCFFKKSTAFPKRFQYPQNLSGKFSATYIKDFIHNTIANSWGVIMKKIIATAVLGSMLLGYSAKEKVDDFTFGMRNPGAHHLKIEYQNNTPYLHDLSTGQSLEIQTEPLALGDIEHRINSFLKETDDKGVLAKHDQDLLDFSQKLEEKVYWNKYGTRKAAPGFIQGYVEVRKILKETPEGIETYITVSSNTQPLTDKFQLGNQKYRIIGLCDENASTIKGILQGLASKVIILYHNFFGGN